MKRTQAKQRLQAEQAEGNLETKWEKNVLDELEKNGGPNKEWLQNQGYGYVAGDPVWGTAASMAVNRVARLAYEDLARSKRMGLRMTEIVEEETKLWRRERSSRKMGRTMPGELHEGPYQESDEMSVQRECPETGSKILPMSKKDPGIPTYVKYNPL